MSTITLTKHLFHKAESVASPAPLVSQDMIDEFKEKVKNLQSKLDTLLVRRAEDKEKMKTTSDLRYSAISWSTIRDR